VCDVKPIFD